MKRREFLETILYAGVATASATQTMAQAATDHAVEQYRQLQAAALKRRQLAYTERYVHVTSLRLRTHVVEVGTGEPLLMIHGGNGEGTHWLPLMPRLPDKRLLVPDRPGCGLTDGFLYDGVNLRMHAVQFVEGFLDAMRVERASIIGNSMGGYFALCFALAHSDRVRKLILAGGPAGSASGQPAPPEAIEIFLKASRQRGRARFGRWMADPRRVSEDMVELSDAALDLPGTEESWRSIARTMGMGPEFRTFSLHSELKGLSTPTLLIWGEQDRVDPPQPAAIAIAQHLRNARLVLLPDAGHLPWLDKPDECAKLVADFLAEA